MFKRTITLAFVQALVVVLGFFALAIVLKVSGYPDYIGVRWNPRAVFLRTHGFWFIFLAPLWACVAVLTDRRDAGIFCCRMVWWTGVGATAAVPALFLYAAIFPYYHLLILKAR